MIGLSTCAYRWRMHAAAAGVWPAERVLEDAARLDVTLIRLCDLPEPKAMAQDALGTEERERLSALRNRGDALGVRFELGKKGIRSGHLLAYLEIAKQLGSRMGRSMVVTPQHSPAVTPAEELLGSVLPSFESAELVVDLETYEQVATADFVGLVSSLNSPALGLCLGPGNDVARLEHPRDVVTATAP